MSWPGTNWERIGEALGTGIYSGNNCGGGTPTNVPVAIGTALGNEAYLPPETLSVGALGNLDTNGDLYVMLPDGDPDLTMFAIGKLFYIFGVSAQKVTKIELDTPTIAPAVPKK